MGSSLTIVATPAHELVLASQDETTSQATYAFKEFRPWRITCGVASESWTVVQENGCRCLFGGSSDYLQLGIAIGKVSAMSNRRIGLQVSSEPQNEHEEDRQRGPMNGRWIGTQGMEAATDRRCRGTRTAQARRVRIP
jgi:hypothetical protein